MLIKVKVRQIHWYDARNRHCATECEWLGLDGHTKWLMNKYYFYDFEVEEPLKQRKEIIEKTIKKSILDSFSFYETEKNVRDAVLNDSSDKLNWIHRMENLWKIERSVHLDMIEPEIKHCYSATDI